MKKNDVGPAFPLPMMENCQDLSVEEMRGMTLRDYFAAKAMHAALLTVKGSEDIETATKICSKAAYLIADAMLEERAK